MGDAPGAPVVGRSSPRTESYWTARHTAPVAMTPARPGQL
jgi:hypothetical protein